VPKLSLKDAKRLLNSKLSVARLATTTQGGKPHVVPVWFISEKNRIYVPSPSRTLKAKNIQKRPDVSLTIDTFEGILNAKGLLAEGKAHILSGPEASKINLRIHHKYVGAKRLKQRGWKEFAAEDDVTIVIEPTKWRSWDFSKLKL
jgi:nitroimidazol reductase NimA-like FMN-containing flavoprotein (pyridoxamine 5'-phosphate oxidase superfamily)